MGSWWDGFGKVGLWVGEVASKVERRNEAEDNTQREETQRTNEAERGEMKQRTTHREKKHRGQTRQKGEMEKKKVKRKKVIWFWRYQCSHILVFSGAKNSNIVF